MYKNKLFIFSIAVLISIGYLSFTSMAADEPLSEVNIFFTPGNANVGPVNPDNPEIPPNGGGPDEGDSGSLVLNEVTPISFGSQEISAYDEYYPALTNRVFLTVTDLRGTQEGWSISAKLSTFKSGDIETLKGAEITFYSPVFDSANTKIAPPTAPSLLTLPADGEAKVKVASAEKNAGMGIWVIRWYTDPNADENHYVYLTVPGASGMLEENTAEITWYLSSVPA